jgi:hypothetical protein
MELKELFLYQTLGQNNQKLFCKRSFRKDFRIIFFAENIEFKRNYLKRQGQGSAATDWHYGKKWIAALGPCGKRRRDEEKKE